MEVIFQWLSQFVINTIDATGYVGIAFLMALESANIPVPSEIIMPFSGFLVFEGRFNLLWVVFWGAFGNLMGSLLSYYLGFFGGRRFVESYGKFILFSKHDLNIANSWFLKYGSTIIFAARVLPIIRTFISFPAGIARMNIFKFLIYTFAGSFVWSYILTYAGVIAGENWKFLEVYFRKLDWAIAILIIAGVVWWIRRHIRSIKNAI